MDEECTTIEVPVTADVAKRLQSLATARGVDVTTLIRVSLMNLSRRGKFYDLDTRVSFGKYSGEFMETVIRCDPSYVSWCLRNSEQFELSEHCIALLKDMETVKES